MRSCGWRLSLALLVARRDITLRAAAWSSTFNRASLFASSSGAKTLVIKRKARGPDSTW